MIKPSLHYIGKIILIKSIRDFILDAKLTENDTILLNQVNFDNIVIEFRNTYNESINSHYFLLSILIKEDDSNSVPLNRVGVIKNDKNRFKDDYKQQSSIDKNLPDESHAYDTIYRCGWCGNVVDFDGSEFDPQTREFYISIHKKFRNTITEKAVSGNCCPNGDSDCVKKRK
jgi:hypothetical protein